MSRPELTDAEAEVLSVAREYGKAVERVMKIHDQGEKVHGLDEFDPKYVSWENRLFYAERARDKARDHLHVASYVLAGGKRKELVGRRKGAKS